LANIIANNTKRASATRFVKLSATMSGVAEVKEVIKIAKNEQSLFQRKTILFIDEIHRFNKMQQVCINK
jgi:putative ATPase